MDGGGRLLRSVNALTGVLDGARPSRATALPVLESGLSSGRGSFIGFFRRKLGRRSSFVSVPLAQRLPRYLGVWMTVGLFVVTGAYGAVRGGHVEALHAHYGEPYDIAARIFGFGIDRVTLSGLNELQEAEILNAAGISGRISLPFVDVADLRERLEALPLVKEAAVRKLYPSDLSISIVERQPFAVWQKDGEVFIIAADGTVIDQMHDSRFINLPFVVGEGANERVKEYAAILDGAGMLRARVKAGILISGRRWTLKLDNGIDVRLPEDGHKAALERLVALEESGKILNRDILAIDLRQSDRVVVRLSEEAAAARLAAKKKTSPKGGDA